MDSLLDSPKLVRLHMCHRIRPMIFTSVNPKFMKFSQGTLALINNLTMPRGAYFQIFKEIIPNSKFAVII